MKMDREIIKALVIKIIAINADKIEYLLKKGRIISPIMQNEIKGRKNTIHTNCSVIISIISLKFHLQHVLYLLAHKL